MKIKELHIISKFVEKSPSNEIAVRVVPWYDNDDLVQIEILSHAKDQI